MSKIGELIIEQRDWTVSIVDKINITSNDYVDNEYALLCMHFKNYKNAECHLVHLEIPEYGYHLTLVPDKYLQFHRRKANNWGTRVSYGDKNVTREFFLDGDFPWFIIPLLDYDAGILRILMFKYNEKYKTDALKYIVKHVMCKSNKIKQEFIINDVLIVDEKKRYAHVESSPKLSPSQKILNEIFEAFSDVYKSKEGE